MYKLVFVFANVSAFKLEKQWRCMWRKAIKRWVINRTFSKLSTIIYCSKGRDSWPSVSTKISLIPKTNVNNRFKCKLTLNKNLTHSLPAHTFVLLIFVVFSFLQGLHTAVMRKLSHHSASSVFTRTDNNENLHFKWWRKPIRLSARSRSDVTWSPHV